jgi:hypothetical protein
MGAALLRFALRQRNAGQTPYKRGISLSSRLSAPVGAQSRFSPAPWEEKLVSPTSRSGQPTKEEYSVECNLVDPGSWTHKPWDAAIALRRVTFRFQPGKSHQRGHLQLCSTWTCA